MTKRIRCEIDWQKSVFGSEVQKDGRIDTQRPSLELHAEIIRCWIRNRSSGSLDESGGDQRQDQATMVYNHQLQPYQS